MLPLTRGGTISSVQQDQEQDETTMVAAVDPKVKLAYLLERLVLRVENLEQYRAQVNRSLQLVLISRKQTYKSHPQQPGHKRTVLSKEPADTVNSQGIWLETALKVTTFPLENTNLQHGEPSAGGTLK